MTQNHSIQRAPHNKEHPYCMISMALINDMDLPLFEKGLLIYMLAKPSGWKTYVQQISKTLNVSEDRILKGFKLLIELGYLKREQTKEKGRFATVNYYFSEEREFKKFPPQPKKPDPVKPDPEKSALINTNEEVNTDLKKKEDIPDSANASPAFSPPSVLLAENVKVTESQYTTLQKQHPPLLIQCAAEKLSEWKQQYPKKAKGLKSDYLALRKWALTAAREEQIKEKELQQREDRIKRVEAEAFSASKYDRRTKDSTGKPVEVENLF